MEEEIKNLKLEVKVLKERIAHLEAKERTRKIIRIIKIVIILAIIIVIIIYGYKWYQDMMNYYNQIKDFVDNPIKSIF